MLLRTRKEVRGLRRPSKVHKFQEMETSRLDRGNSQKVIKRRLDTQGNK